MCDIFDFIRPIRYGSLYAFPPLKRLLGMLPIGVMQRFICHSERLAICVYPFCATRRNILLKPSNTGHEHWGDSMLCVCVCACTFECTTNAARCTDISLSIYSITKKQINMHIPIIAMTHRLLHPLRADTIRRTSDALGRKGGEGGDCRVHKAVYLLAFPLWRFLRAEQIRWKRVGFAFHSSWAAASLHNHNRITLNAVFLFRIWHRMCCV